MRYLLIFGMLLCLLLSSCELVTPSASNALSQTRQQEELAKQTEQIKQQTGAIERLANSVEKLADSQEQQLNGQPLK